VSIATDTLWWVAADGDGLHGGSGGLDGGENEARKAKVEHLLGLDGAGLGEAQHSGGVCVRKAEVLVLRAASSRSKHEKRHNT
jgi:hypothetical protein